MDIGALSMAMSQNVVSTQASMAVLNMQLDNTEQMSSNVVSMIESVSFEPGKGANLDQYV